MFGTILARASVPAFAVSVPGSCSLAGGVKSSFQIETHRTLTASVHLDGGLCFFVQLPSHPHLTISALRQMPMDMLVPAAATVQMSLSFFSSSFLITAERDGDRRNKRRAKLSSAGLVERNRCSSP